MSKANEPDSVNTGALATTIGIVAFATLGIALYVTSLVREETKVLGDTRQGTQDRPLRELRADQLGVLDATPTWKDRGAGVVTLPIDRAMEWMVEAVRKNPKALSPWQPPPKEEAMGGAGPDGEPLPLGTGGAGASSDGASSDGASSDGASPDGASSGAASPEGAEVPPAGASPTTPANPTPASAPAPAPAAAPTAAPTGAP